MGKKTYNVLNRIYHGVGSKHTMLEPGDTVEFDTADPDQADTITTLIEKDYIEDPDKPRQRTPDEKAAIEKRQIAAAELRGPSATAVKAEQHTNARMQGIADGKIEPSPEEERRWAASRRAAEREAEKV